MYSQTYTESDMYELTHRPGIQHLSELLHLDSDSGKSMHETHKFEEPVKVPDHDLGKIFSTKLSISQKNLNNLEMFIMLSLSFNHFHLKQFFFFETAAILVQISLMFSEEKMVLKV
jgi:hypothetical protein